MTCLQFLSGVFLLAIYYDLSNITIAMKQKYTKWM